SRPVWNPSRDATGSRRPDAGREFSSESHEVERSSEDLLRAAGSRVLVMERSGFGQQGAVVIEEPVPGRFGWIVRIASPR
ncbi:MAG: hypothetical protein ACKOTB_11950, partial [Planctomycetia bacterium]